MENFNTDYGTLSFLQEDIDEITYNYYWKFLLMIGLYYILPALQFVFFQAHDSNVYCYYNEKCQKTLEPFPAFNNVISNIFYVIFGLIFIILVRLTHVRISDGISRYGVNLDPSLYYSLGITLFLEGICSSIYHICPSKLNFQFDTTFMFMGSALLFLVLYQKRHYVDSINPIKFFSILSLIIFMNFLPLSGLSNGVEIWFWIIIFVIITYTVIFGSIYIYFGREYNLEWNSLILLINNIKNSTKNTLPKVILVLLINSFTLGMYIYGTMVKPDFTDWMLGVLIINTIIYFIYYIIQKIIHKEQIPVVWWLFFIFDIVIISFAIIFYLDNVSNILLTPKESKALNKDCILFGYFDNHDIWHILSACGLFNFMCLIYFIDIDLNNIPYNEITVF